MSPPDSFIGKEINIIDSLQNDKNYRSSTRIE